MLSCLGPTYRVLEHFEHHLTQFDTGMFVCLLVCPFVGRQVCMFVCYLSIFYSPPSSLPTPHPSLPLFSVVFSTGLAERQALVKHYLKEEGPNWLWNLQINFNLLFYGVGCKRELVMKFVGEYLHGCHVLAIDGR